MKVLKPVSIKIEPLGAALNDDCYNRAQGLLCGVFVAIV